MSKTDFVQLLDQLHKNKLAVADIDAASLEPGVRELVARKKEIYAETDRLRLENGKINDELVDLMAAPAIAEKAMVKERLAAHKAVKVLLCW